MLLLKESNTSANVFMEVELLTSNVTDGHGTSLPMKGVLIEN